MIEDGLFCGSWVICDGSDFSPNFMRFLIEKCETRQTSSNLFKMWLICSELDLFLQFSALVDPSHCIEWIALSKVRKI